MSFICGYLALLTVFGIASKDQFQTYGILLFLYISKQSCLNIIMEYYRGNQIVLIMKPNSNWAKVFTRLSIPDNNPALMFRPLATGI